jgi:multiple sugar transport system ATP-binding protein
VASVTLSGLSRHFEGQRAPALSNLTLEVADGELLVLVGPSGCGKSTALRLIAGLDRPDAGTICIDGCEVGEVPPQDRDVAMVFQGYALYPHLSVREIIAFPLKMRGIGRLERERRAGETASMLGLSGLLDRRPGELSGGERQRVAMGRAIVRSPRVFLFDEPLSNLDAALRAELRVELVSLIRRLGTTSLYVTHDQVEAMTMGDRIAVLRKGVLEQVGPPRAIYEQPANTFVAGFLGTPPMNLIALDSSEGRVHGAGLDLPVPPELDLPPKVILGVRPEHIRIGAAPAQASTVASRATVLTVEPLGAETYIYLDSGGTPLRARTGGFDAPLRGESVPIHFMSESIHWFDPESGKRIGRPERSRVAKEARAVGP